MRTVTLSLSSVPPARPTPAPGATATTTSARLRPALLSTATTGPISRQVVPCGQPSGMASASAVCFVNSHRSPLHGRSGRPARAHGAGPGPPGRTAVDLPIAALGPSRGRGYVALGAISRSDCGSQHAPEAMADRAHGARREAARRRNGTPLLASV